MMSLWTPNMVAFSELMKNVKKKVRPVSRTLARSPKLVRARFLKKVFVNQISCFKVFEFRIILMYLLLLERTFGEITLLWCVWFVWFWEVSKSCAFRLNQIQIEKQQNILIYSKSPCWEPSSQILPRQFRAWSVALATNRRRHHRFQYLGPPKRRFQSKNDQIPIFF